VIDERRCQCRAFDELREHRINLERPPGVHNLIAGVDVGEQQLLQQPNRATPNSDRVRADPQPTAQPSSEFGAPMIGIPIDAARAVRDRGKDGVDRRQRVLVRRQLDRIGDAVLGFGLRRSLTRTVRRQGVDRRARAIRRCFRSSCGVHRRDGTRPLATTAKPDDLAARR